jgi:hypothetical protein
MGYAVPLSCGSCEPRNQFLFQLGKRLAQIEPCNCQPHKPAFSMMLMEPVKIVPTELKQISALTL